MKSPYLAKALPIAAIACSRMPKCKFLPHGKSPPPFSSVLFDAAKSALPPKKPGTAFAMAFKILPLLSRVATLSPLKSGNSILLKSGFKSLFRSALFSSLSFASFSFQSRSSKSPLSTAARVSKSTSSLTTKLWAGSKPRLCLARASSSSPSGAPCVLAVPSSSSAPLPIVVFAMMR